MESLKPEAERKIKSKIEKFNSDYFFSTKMKITRR